MCDCVYVCMTASCHLEHEDEARCELVPCISLHAVFASHLHNSSYSIHREINGGA